MFQGCPVHLAGSCGVRGRAPGLSHRWSRPFLPPSPPTPGLPEHLPRSSRYRICNEHPPKSPPPPSPPRSLPPPGDAPGQVRPRSLPVATGTEAVAVPGSRERPTPRRRRGHSPPLPPPLPLPVPAPPLGPGGLLGAAGGVGRGGRGAGPDGPGCRGEQPVIPPHPDPVPP